MSAIPYYVFAWIASLLYGAEVIIGKLTSKYMVSNPWLFNFAGNLTASALILPFALSQGVNFPSHWGNIVWASVFYTLGGTFYALALYKLDVSVLSPLFNFRTVFAVFLGVSFLNEVLSGTQYLLVAIIFFAGILVCLDENWKLKSFLNRGVVWLLADTLVLALMSLFVNKSISEIGLWSATFWIDLFCVLLLLPTIPLFKNSLKEMTLKPWLVFVLFAFMSTASLLAVNKAFADNISITTVIIAIPVSMILAFLFSVFKPELLEKHTNKVYAVRFIAAAVMIIAAIKLTL